MVQNIDHRAGRYIALAHRSSMSYIGSKLKKYKLKNITFPILLSLETKSPSTVSYIGKDIGYDKSIASRGIKELVALGFAKKEVSPKNKSSYDIYITEKGVKIMPKIYEVLQEWEDKILKDVEDKETFLKNLKSVFENAREI